MKDIALLCVAVLAGVLFSGCVREITPQGRAR